MLYSLALYCLVPLVFLYLLVRSINEPGYRQRWPERLGFCRGKVRPGGIVVHAVSVGEVNAAAGLVHALADRYPELPLTVSCFTPTGSRRIQSLFAGSLDHVYWPLDLPWAARRFLRSSRPRLLVIMETEIWPNMYAQAAQQGIPIVLANARISDHSFARYQRLGGLTRQALARVDRLGAQSAEDMRRFLALGAAPENTRLTGNLKYDLKLPAGLQAKGQDLRNSWGADRPVLLAASTREGEEAIMIEAFQPMLERFPSALLVLVPRHPERFDEVARLVESRGLGLARYSQPLPEWDSVSCYLVDTMGELLNFYAACDLAFVGGSLANTGGHNVLEAAAQAKPVLVGPNTFNFAEITQKLVAGGGAQRVIDAGTLQGAIEDLLRNPDRRRAMGLAGLAVMESEQGALDRTLDMVSELLNRDQTTRATG